MGAGDQHAGAVVQPGQQFAQRITQFTGGLGVQAKIDESLAGKERRGLGGLDEPAAVEACISLIERSGAVERAFEKGKTLVKEKSAELASPYGASGEDTTPQPIIDLFASMIKKQEADYVREKMHA